jgi:hypothetical protein
MGFLYLSPFLAGLILVGAQIWVLIKKEKLGKSFLKPDFLIAYFVCWVCAYLIDHQSNFRLLPYLGIAWIFFKIWKR